MKVGVVTRKMKRVREEIEDKEVREDVVDEIHEGMEIDEADSVLTEEHISSHSQSQSSYSTTSFQSSLSSPLPPYPSPESHLDLCQIS